MKDKVTMRAPREIELALEAWLDIPDEIFDRGNKKEIKQYHLKLTKEYGKKENID